MLGANFLAGLLGAGQATPEEDVSERKESSWSWCT
jgi:hypothetical protein